MSNTHAFEFNLTMASETSVWRRQYVSENAGESCVYFPYLVMIWEIFSVPKHRHADAVDSRSIGRNVRLYPARNTFEQKF